ncbi:MAG: CapA family protein, partial [Armatimonadetes bacterium]|nr:CapA family protein [Armatimonadota bacterium]
MSYGHRIHPTRRAHWSSIVLACILLSGCLARSEEGPKVFPPSVFGNQPPAAPSPREVTIAAVGDVMLDRAVGGAIERRGPESILACVRDRLRAADIAFCNLESPLSSRGPRAPRDCVFRARPSAVAVLKDGGFDVVSIANNHTLNSGRRT